MRIRILFALLALASSVSLSDQDVRSESPVARAPREIVFVCEHGAALSVVSAAYFNKLAKERHLNMHAIARGVSPQENISSSAATGLKADGVATGVAKPEALSQDDLARSDYVVTFLPLPPTYSVNVPLEIWTDVPSPGVGYSNSREAILRHMRLLVDKLATGPAQQSR